LRIHEAWTGLRPGTPDAMPILGATTIGGYFVATGHFRDGIMLAPITAALITDMVLGNEPRLDLSPFSPARFSRT
jgi:glycine oxidase